MIGIFDSGIGGLTVAREVMRQLPGFSILYLGDTARTPYGNKGPEVIRQYARECAEWLVSRGARLLVVACNTMSALAVTDLRTRMSVPVFDVIGPTVREAIRCAIGDEKRIAVIGTRATIDSRIYERIIAEIHPGASVYSAACPLLVPLVEEGWLDRPETHRIAKMYLAPLRNKFLHSLILGCTHYPFLLPIIRQQIGRRPVIVNSAEASVGYLKAYLDAHPEIVDELQKGNRHQWHLTDVAPHHDELAASWLGWPVKFVRAELASRERSRSQRVE